MPPTAAILRQLARLAWQFGPEAAARKRLLLRALGRRQLPTADDVRALHELLCLWRAYPDDAALLARVDALLAGFARRRDVARRRADLENSGIAGTDLVYPFGAPTARWLATTVPGRLSIAWDRMEDTGRLGRHLLLLALAAEVPGFDEAPIEDVRAWCRRLAGSDTDATFVIRETSALDAPPLVRDRMFDELDLPISVAAGRETPTRTTPRWSRAPVVFRSTPLDHERPNLVLAAAERPLAFLGVGRRDADRLIHLAHEAMVTRERDLDAFASADPRDVRVIDWPGGLQFACFGVLPDRRFLLEAVYAFLILQNGVPLGYALASALFGSSELAYNVFETFRRGEAAAIYGRLVATVRLLFASDTFAIYPYQLGHGNEEGLKSGAWWFYYKLGFRPREPSLQPIIARELARIARRRSYRTPPAMLERLVRFPMFLSLGPVRNDVIGVLRMDRLGLAVTDRVTRRFGSVRARAEALCIDEAARRLNLVSRRGWSADERLFWRRWAPLVCVLPWWSRWTAADRLQLARAIRAKGSRRESDAVPLLTAHAAFRRAIGQLMR